MGPKEPTRTDRLLEDIDSLIDESLARGDRSQSFHGEQMEACHWCKGEWHYLPITWRMEEMRNGSYGRDEFGQGIFDPDYSYEKDESPWLCPGSEAHGVEHWTGIWNKALREKMIRSRIRNKTLTGTMHPTPQEREWALEGWNPPLFGTGTSQSQAIWWRFKPPRMEDWTVMINEDRTIDYNPRTGEREVSNWIRTISWRLDRNFENCDPQWIVMNNRDIEESIFTFENQGTCTMKAITFEYEDLKPHFENDTDAYPEYVDVLTTYPIQEHLWWRDWWTCAPPRRRTDEWSFNQVASHLSVIIIDSEGNPHQLRLTQPREYRQGYETVRAIIDESYEMSTRGTDSVCDCGRSDPHFAEQGFTPDEEEGPDER